MVSGDWLCAYECSRAPTHGAVGRLSHVPCTRRLIPSRRVPVRRGGWGRAVTKQLVIVIVEDDVLIAMDLADLLIGMGHDVRTVARTEAEAVAAAAMHRPDLMIVDGHLAEGSGVSAMRRILAKGFVPHIYVTGNSLGIDGLPADAIVIGKPFNLHGLMGSIAGARRSAPSNVTPRGTS